MMKIQKVLISSFCTVLLIGLFVSEASAVSLDCVNMSRLPCTANAGDVLAGGAVVPGNGNDKEVLVEAAIEIATGNFVDLTDLGKSDGGYGDPVSGQSGTWTITDFASFISVKGANSFNVFAVSGTTGSWDTSNIDNGGGNQPNVSHITYWGGLTNGATTPEPGTVLLLGSGLLGLGLWLRKTKKYISNSL